MYMMDLSKRKHFEEQIKELRKHLVTQKEMTELTKDEILKAQTALEEKKFAIHVKLIDATSKEQLTQQVVE